MSMPTWPMPTGCGNRVTLVANGMALAREEGLDLGYRHWLVIAFLRGYYDEYQIAPSNRALTKAIGRLLGQEWRNSEPLYELFEYSPGPQAARYAGLPQPFC